LRVLGEGEKVFREIDGTFFMGPFINLTHHEISGIFDEKTVPIFTIN
jgi:hypothetical protein